MPLQCPVCRLALGESARARASPARARDEALQALAPIPAEARAALHAMRERCGGPAPGAPDAALARAALARYLEDEASRGAVQALRGRARAPRDGGAA